MKAIFFFFLGGFLSLQAQIPQGTTDFWVKKEEMLYQKNKKTTFKAKNAEFASFYLIHQWQNFTNPLAFHFGFEFPLQTQLIFRKRNKNRPDAVKKHTYSQRFGLGYHYHKELFHDFSLTTEFVKNWTYRYDLFWELGPNLGYHIHFLPAYAYQVSNDLTKITEEQTPKTHHFRLGFFAAFGKSFYWKEFKANFFMRSQAYLLTYNIGFAGFYTLELGASFLLYRKKSFIKN